MFTAGLCSFFIKQPLECARDTLSCLFAYLQIFYEVLQCGLLLLAVDQLLRIQLGASQLDRFFYVASFRSSLLSHLLVRCFTYSTRHFLPSLLVLLVPGCFNRACGKGGLLSCSAHHYSCALVPGLLFASLWPRHSALATSRPRTLKVRCSLHDRLL